MVTNGKLKGKVGKLLDMIDNGASLHLELSQDEYHDPIDPFIRRRFERGQQSQDRLRFSYQRGREEGSIGVRTAHRIMPVGRAITTGVSTETLKDNSCCCETPLVDASGTVWSCGCKIHKLGSIWRDDVLDGYDSEYAHAGGYAPAEENEGWREAA